MVRLPDAGMSERLWQKILFACYHCHFITDFLKLALLLTGVIVCSVSYRYSLKSVKLGLFTSCWCQMVGNSSGGHYNT